MHSEVIYGFRVTEFVPPEIYKMFGAQAWMFIDERIVLINKQLKQDFNAPVIINNWAAGGVRRYSGYRPITCKTGGDNSQHRHGRASDTLITGYTSDEVRAHILKHKAKYMSLGLSRMEDAKFAPTWAHIDCAWTGVNDIVIVKPLK